MRFARVYLRAYGRFTDAVLTFPRVPEGDLQLVFGPNEAGKSTTLSAATDFLFGFEPRASYHFRHGPKELRVGASLETADGELHAMRRRGHKQTLFALDPASQQEETRKPLADDVLAALLSGLDRETYRMLFGLDLDGLVEGGKALAEGQGEVGQSLFQAAAGLSVLKRVGSDLGTVADELFKRTGKTPALNKAIAAYTDQGRKVREISVRSSQWEAADQLRQKTAQTHERLLRERRQARDEKDRLGRIQRNLPDLVRRKGLLEALVPLKDAPRLPQDAEKRRGATEDLLRTAQWAERSATDTLERLTEERTSIEVDSRLLAASQTVERLDRQADAYVQAREMLARNAGTLAAVRLRLREMLDEIAPGTLESEAARLLPSRALTASVKGLIQRRPELDLKRDNFRDQRDKARAELTKAQAMLAALPELRAPDDLLAAIEGLDDYPQLELGLRRLAAQLAADRAELQRKAAATGHGDPNALARLHAPARAEVRHFQTAFEALARRRADLASKMDALQASLRDCRREIRRLEADGDVVTRVQVRQLRDHRDRLWKVVRRLFVDGDATARAAAAANGTDKALPEALERSTLEADRLADHLRADTERATQYAVCTEQIQALEQKRAALQTDLAGVDADREALHLRWEALCTPLGLRDATPETVVEWMQNRDSFLEQFKRMADQEIEFAASTARRDVLSQDLARVLGMCGLPDAAPGESAAFAMQRLRQHHGAVLVARTRREELVTSIGEIEPEVQRLHAACERAGEPLARWDREWLDALPRLHLPSTMGCDAVEVRLEQFDRLAKVIDELHSAERIEAEQREIVTGFERSVAALNGSLDRSDEGLSPELWVRRLYEELVEARKLSDRSTQIAQSIQRAQEVRRQALHDLGLAQEALVVMAREANCDPDALPEVHRRALERLRLESELAQVDRALIELNGRTVEEIEDEATAHDVDSIAHALRELDERVTRLDDEEGAARDARSEALRAFEAMDGSAAAAEMQQQQAEIGAQIQAHANRWSRARLASAILQRVVQQYRERHQGPLLDRSSAIFAAITCGSFAGLTTDYDDDRQILLGVRPGGEKSVRVEGMSKGTCDQLYLALRLATIEAHIASRGPMPVIVDDLLVQFDDERALATLRQLQALAVRTQVLFFTHHEHLIDLAVSSGAATAAQIHRLATRERITS